MTIEEIKSLRVKDFAADNSVLFLWTIDKFLIDGTAGSVASLWGFDRLRTFVWRKTGFGLGTFPRPQHEICLIGKRGKPIFKVRNVGSAQTWKNVYAKHGKGTGKVHSAKPPEFIRMIEAAIDGPYLELFARENRERWHSWGNECRNDVAIA